MDNKEEDVVIYFNGHYYGLTKTYWEAAPKLAKTTAQFAKDEVIDKHLDVGYVPRPKDGAEGGYSTVLNLSAILKKHHG